jgi:hypothetical protein
LRFDRMSGLGPEQLDELEDRVTELLGNPWDSGTGRPRELTLREAIIVSSGYMRQNIIEDVWAEIFDTSQPTISRIITEITPLIEKATAEFRPAAEQAKAAVRGQTVLVDGFLAPCWSWHGAPELWSGKHKTTGFKGQVISNLAGDIVFVSEPVTGHNHDMIALSKTGAPKLSRQHSAESATRGTRGPATLPRSGNPSTGSCLNG